MAYWLKRCFSGSTNFRSVFGQCKEIFNYLNTYYCTWAANSRAKAFVCKLWIAYKLIIFVLLETALAREFSKRRKLWIAYKLIIFVLLETACLFMLIHWVVLWIAYKLIIFVLLETAKAVAKQTEKVLWIAYKLIIFVLLETAW